MKIERPEPDNKIINFKILTFINNLVWDKYICKQALSYKQIH